MRSRMCDGDSKLTGGSMLRDIYSNLELTEH